MKQVFLKASPNPKDKGLSKENKGKFPLNLRS